MQETWVQSLGLSQQAFISHQQWEKHYCRHRFAIWDLFEVKTSLVKYCFVNTYMCFPGGVVVKNFPANAGDARDIGSVTGLGRPLELEMATDSSILGWKNSTDRGVWWAPAWHGVAKSQTWLSTHTHTHTHTHTEALTSQCLASLDHLTTCKQHIWWFFFFTDIYVYTWKHVYIWEGLNNFMNILVSPHFTY